MGVKINFDYVSDSYKSYIVKNKDNGRRYLQITCPSCGIVFDKREYYDHVLKVHSKRKDEVLAKLFGLKEFPVICADCGKEVHFNESTGIFSRKCNICTERDKVLGPKGTDDMSIEELLEQQKNLEATFKARQDSINAQIEAKRRELEWKSIDLKSVKPRFLPDSVKFLRKFSYELRVHNVNGDKQKINELLNFMDKYLDTEPWKSEKEG